MMVQYGRIAIDANTIERYFKATKQNLKLKEYVPSFPMYWETLYKYAGDLSKIEDVKSLSKLKMRVNL